MMVAQQLYEGVEIDNGGPVGLITYMRTDSPRVAAEAQAEARDVIAARYGPDTLPSGLRSTGPGSRPRKPTRRSGRRCSTTRRSAWPVT